MPGLTAAPCDYDIVIVAITSGATGTFDIVGNCGGKTPKGGVLIATRATALDTQTAGAMISVSVWEADGTTRLVSCMSETGVNIGAYNTGRRQAQVILQELSANDHTLTGEAAFSAVSANTLTINITDAFPSALQLEAWLFYGDDMQCHVDSAAGSATENVTIVETGIPFMPRALIGIGAVGGFATSAVSARHAIGFAAFNDDGTLQGQCGMPFFDRNIPTTVTATGGGFRTDSWIQRIIVDTGGTLTEEARYELGDATSDGFPLTTIGGANSITIGYLAIYTGTLRAWVGAPSITTGSTGSRAITSTGPGWRPRALFALGSRQAFANLDTYVSDSQSLHFSIGGAVLGSQASACYHAGDNTSPTSATRSYSATALMSVWTTQGGDSIDWEASLTSFDAEGFTVNVDDASGADRLIGFLAFEDGALYGNDTETISETAILAITATDFSETETISESIAQVIDEALSETETIVETVDLITANAIMELVFDETETIVEDALLLIGTPVEATETVTISETVDLIATAAADTVLDETVTISETFTFLISTAIFDVTDTVSISETAFLFLGQVIVADDTVTIEEDSNYGAGLVAMKATRAGGVFQW